MRRLSTLVIAIAILLPLTVLASTPPQSQPSSSTPLLDNNNNNNNDLDNDNNSLLDPRQDLSSLIPILPVLSDVLTRLQKILLLLKAQFFEDVATLISGLADLMAAPLPAQLRGLVNTATDLLGGLGPVLRFIGKIDFASITDSLQALFEPAFVQQHVQFVKDVSGLITAQFVGEFVNVVNGLAPLISATSQFLTALIASLLA